jgi:hypothetical protein
MSLIKRYDLSIKKAILISKNYGFIMPEDYNIITEEILGCNDNYELEKSLTLFLKKELNKIVFELTELIFSWHYYLNLIEGANFNLNNIKNEFERKKACSLLELAGKNVKNDTSFMQEAFAGIIIKVVTNSKNELYSYSTFGTSLIECQKYLDITPSTDIPYKPNKKD